jgi:hypothetical protein
MQGYLLNETLPVEGKDVLVKLSDGTFTVASLELEHTNGHDFHNWRVSNAVESYDNGYSGVIINGDVVKWYDLPEN